MEYGKGLGIAAIVFAILAIFVPFVGFYVAILASCLAIAAAFFGDKVFVLATSAVTAVNLYFLTLTTTTIFQRLAPLSIVGTAQSPWCSTSTGAHGRSERRSILAPMSAND